MAPSILTMSNRTPRTVNVRVSFCDNRGDDNRIKMIENSVFFIIMGLWREIKTWFNGLSTEILSFPPPRLQQPDEEGDIVLVDERIELSDFHVFHLTVWFLQHWTTGWGNPYKNISSSLPQSPGSRSTGRGRRKVSPAPRLFYSVGNSFNTSSLRTGRCFRIITHTVAESTESYP